jgi:hypothetical protein
MELGTVGAAVEDDPNQLLAHETTCPSMVAVTQTEDGEAPGGLAVLSPNQLFSHETT